MSHIRKHCSKKYSAIHKPNFDVRKLRIRIKIKEITSVSSFLENEVPFVPVEESRYLRWQDKIYSKTERIFYRDFLTGTADLEKNRFEHFMKKFHSKRHIFTYTNNENVTEEDVLVDSNYKSEVLSQKMEELRNEKSKNVKTKKRDKISKRLKKFDMIESILNSANNPLDFYDFEMYHIMADFGHYDDDKWIKREFRLCTMKYDKNKKKLFLNPDFSVSDPYYFEFEDEHRKRIFHYYIDNVSETKKHKVDIFDKINHYKAHIRKLKVGTYFELAPANKMKVHLYLEILKGKNFKNGNIFVEYLIDLPTYLTCDRINERTWTSRCNSEKTSFFGTPFDIIFECDLDEFKDNNILQSPCIYFEVVSEDTFNRYRTEGLTYLVLPIFQPGIHNFQLNCIRMKSENWISEFRRYLIGDYRCYENIHWINKPMDYEDTILSKFGSLTLSTGQLDIRLNIITQSNAFLLEKPKDNFETKQAVVEKLRCSSLIKSVEEVLQEYRRVKKKMVEARLIALS